VPFGLPPPNTTIEQFAGTVVPDGKAAVVEHLVIRNVNGGSRIIVKLDKFIPVVDGSVAVSIADERCRVCMYLVDHPTAADDRLRGR
jgi:hypothetical protein